MSVRPGLVYMRCPTGKKPRRAWRAIGSWVLGFGRRLKGDRRRAANPSRRYAGCSRLGSGIDAPRPITGRVLSGARRGIAACVERSGCGREAYAGRGVRVRLGERQAPYLTWVRGHDKVLRRRPDRRLRARRTGPAGPAAGAWAQFPQPRRSAVVATCVRFVAPSLRKSPFM